MNKNRAIASAAHLIRGRMLESYLLLEDLLEKDPEEGIADKIVQAVATLSQYEQAFSCLERNREGLLEGPIPEAQEPTQVEVEEVPEEDDAPGIVIDAERSPTFERAMSNRAVVMGEE